MVDCSPRHAILYARVSRALPQTKSTADQLTELRAWATREQWHIVGEFADDGISASRYSNGKARPGWSSVVDLLGAGGVDILACWEISRASRDRAVFAALLAQCIDTSTLIATGGRVHDPGDADDAFMLDLTGSLAVRESAMTSKRVRRAAKSRAHSGRPHGGLGYGYRRVCDQTTGQTIDWEIDPDTAPVVIEIVERLLRGEPAEGIARDLNHRGIPTPQAGKRWHCSSIAKLARRAAYAGLRTHHGRILDGISGTWRPLITPEQYYGVLARYNAPERDRWRSPVTVRHLGSGLYRCGLCSEGRMRVVIETGKKPRYDCRNCHRVSRLQQPVDELVEAVLIGRLSQPDVLDALNEDDPQVAQAQSEVTRLERKLRELTTAYDEDRLDLADYTEAAGKTRRRLEDAQQRCRPRHVPEVVSDLAGEQAAARWAESSIAVRRAILDVLIEVTILPTAHRFQPFDPESVKVRWK